MTASAESNKGNLGPPNVRGMGPQPYDMNFVLCVTVATAYSHLIVDAEWWSGTLENRDRRG